ncbi:hypothetical protein VZ94_14450 [Methylocucumis oryzae]|uniref:Uncharacterized protein n=1 Tax=Methylocucumis oryzae TaxID=1632867 RepID=A0A0F3IGT4_9GAMM|nr:hypothetical protein VZ94_14450 [Methylocucumis oryzae]
MAQNGLVEGYKNRHRICALFYDKVIRVYLVSNETFLTYLLDEHRFIFHYKSIYYMFLLHFKAA